MGSLLSIFQRQHYKRLRNSRKARIDLRQIFFAPEKDLLGGNATKMKKEQIHSAPFS
jgi:hypothetical protein